MSNCVKVFGLFFLGGKFVDSVAGIIILLFF